MSEQSFSIIFIGNLYLNRNITNHLQADSLKKREAHFHKIAGDSLLNANCLPL